MNKFKFTALIVIVIALLGSSAVLADIEVTASLSSPVIALDEQVLLNISITGSKIVAEPKLPPLAAFKVYTSGRSTTMTNVNGQVTNAITYKYILIPTSVGKFLIGSSKVVLQGKEYATEPLALEVTRTSSGQSARPSQSRKGANATEDGEYIITAEVSKDTVYEGEQLVHTFRAYQQRGLRLFSEPVYLSPAYSGFWREDFGWQRYNKNYKGNSYLVSEMRSYLFPVNPGTVTIDPTRVAVTLDEISQLFSFDPFNSRTSNRRNRGMEIDTLKTKPLTIEVLPLPREGRPRSFLGSVGDFKMSVNLSNTKVTVDETMLLTIRISGEGNIRTITPPVMPEIEGLDIRPSGDTTVVKQAGGKISGSKVFEFSIIPEQEGIYEIPSLQWSYFDPGKKTYKTHKSKKYTVSIDPGMNGSDDVLTNLMTLPGDIKVRDILSVKTESSDLKPIDSPLLAKPIFWGLNALPLIALAGVIALRRRQDRLMGDIRYRRLKRAVGMAKKRLSQAGKLLKQGDNDAFYSEVSRALFEYMGDKFNYVGTGLTESQVLEILQRENFPDTLIAEFRDLIRTADFGRFAPGQSGEDSASGLHAKAVEWIVAAEQEGKRVR